MTRVLILGNSHAATLRRAFPAIAAAHPDLTLSFWGLPGAAFAKASTGPDGHLRPDPADHIGLRKVNQWGIADSVDLAAHDQIFLVGSRYNLRNALALMRSLHPLDWGLRDDGALGVATGFLRDALRAEIDSVLTALGTRIPCDSRFVVMPAPYPAVCTLNRGPLYEPLNALITTLPQADDLMTLFETELVRAHAASGLTLVLQPRATLGRPFLTQDRFLEDAATDARHMNADYGLLAFDALLAASRSTPPAAHAAAPATA